MTEKTLAEQLELNRREHRRMEVDTTLHFRRAGEREHLRGRVRNLSAGGVLFESPVPLEAGQELEIVVRPATGAVAPLCAQLLVVRVEPLGEGVVLVAGEMREVR